MTIEQKAERLYDCNIPPKSSAKEFGKSDSSMSLQINLGEKEKSSFKLDYRVDYNKLIENHPLEVIDINNQSPSIRLKISEQPNRPIRNKESREEHARRHESSI
jgi:hypothetical protein